KSVNSLRDFPLHKRAPTPRGLLVGYTAPIAGGNPPPAWGDVLHQRDLDHQLGFSGERVNQNPEEPEIARNLPGLSSTASGCVYRNVIGVYILHRPLEYQTDSGGSHLE